MLLYCSYCDGTVSDILSNFQKHKKVETEIKKYKNDIECKLKELDKRIAGCETGKITAEKLTKRVETAEQKLVNNPTVSELEEKQEIEARKKNLIFFGIPEVEADTIEERLELEYECVETALSGKADIEYDEVADFFRLGKREPDSDRTRPLLMKFNDEDSKLRVLKASRDLKIKINSEVHKIHVSNDLTPKQREEFKKLKDKLKARQERGEQDLIIRGNKIVKREFFLEQQRKRTRTIWATIRQKKNTAATRNEDDEETETKNE